MKKENCNKPLIVGKISNHQWGVVFFRGGSYPTITAHIGAYPNGVVRKWRKIK